MIKAQGELAQNLAKLRKLAACDMRLGRTCFHCPLPLTSSVSLHRCTPAYCVVTPSPANEIMNSRLDTKADEGIFEHSKGERGEKEGENIPKINFHLQGSCIFNRERLNIIG